MDLQLIPVDGDGQRVDLNPSAIKDMDNITLTEFLAQAKIIADLYKKGETEVKKRLDEGQQFNRLGYGKKSERRVLKMNNKQKRDLVISRGWDCVEPIPLGKLIEKFGKDIENELPVVITENKAPLKWDA
ncbi:hypothetical protein [Lactococcus lactis]|uniref:Phage protein n=1 Tax=Lactococcus lactis TaxID=1358 RepID=A0A552YZL5_9LACT|nr:hypothetical protein [Lactococcus lactis]MCT0079484.1 hypothetical protein [Lactococcus lactis subsp. lactis]MCT0442691.1 hypothetical protein [Lactococcus lactis subsp. lactis]TRW72709.1 hypothetical protein FNJ53_10370 [Lactococcus lactis]